MPQKSPTKEPYYQVAVTVELKRVMRQGEEGFVRVLNELRWGKVSGKSAVALLACQQQARSAQWCVACCYMSLHIGGKRRPVYPLP